MGNSISQKLKYKQSVIKFSFKYGVTKAAIKFGESRRTIYRWIQRYDGTLESLKDKSRRPHFHPNQHTAEEIQLIKNYGISDIWGYALRLGGCPLLESERKTAHSANLIFQSIRKSVFLIHIGIIYG